MIVEFDKFSKTRVPSLILCNPNGDKLFHMAMAKERNLSIKLNALSELTFEVSDLGEDTPYYDFLITRRYVEVPNVARFVITNVKEVKDGIYKYKEVTCKGLEYELSSKNVGLMEGTYKLYDPSSADKSLMSIVLSYLPNWKIGTIEDDLWNIYRTFDIKDNNIYNFLMTEVQEAYQCIFVIDTFNRTISAKKVDSIIKPTDIFLSDRNLIKSLEIDEDAESIKTALDIYGDGDLSIHSVNPLGTATIYDFSYYKSVPEMMSSGLIDAITRWETKLGNSKVEYTTLLTDIKNCNSGIISLNTQLTDLKAELKTLQEEEAMKVAAGEDLTDVQSRIASKKAQILEKENEIKTQQGIVDTKRARLKTISVELKFETNFTKDELNELATYIIQETHQCTNFSITDAMTTVEKQEVMQELYDYGSEQLRRVSQPTYTFDIDVVNFLRLFEYKYTIEQFELGCEVTICINRDKDKYARVMLLGYDTNLDDVTDLTLHFSNKLKFGDDKYLWEELMDKSNSISTSVDFESPSWNKGEAANSKIDDYINSALDLTQQEIINSDNQEFTLTAQGLRGKEWDEANKRYKPEQLWMTKNVLAFSDNGFTGRPRMVLGKILAPDGTMVYGVNAEVIVGNIMLTKKLVVENENSTFKVDGEKVFIKNADIIMTNDSGKETTLENALASAGNEIYYQPNEPTTPTENDIWYDTDNGNKAKVYKNGKWQDATDQDIVNALDSANSALDKVNAVTNTDGSLNPSTMVGQILTGKSNIVCSTSATTGNVLAMNENGIFVGTRRADGSLNQTVMTCITKDGIIADSIKSGTIEGVTIIGGAKTGIHTTISPTDTFCIKKGDAKIVEFWGTTSGSISTYQRMWSDYTNSTVEPNGQFERNVSAAGITDTMRRSDYNMRVHAKSGDTAVTGIVDMYCDNDFKIACGKSSGGNGVKLFAGRNSLMEQPNLAITAYNAIFDVPVSMPTVRTASISAYGDKNSIIPTQHYGVRKLYCDESDTSYFTTKGIGMTDSCRCEIMLNEMFLETIEKNSDCRYIVNVTPYSNCRVWVESVQDDRFTVCSDRDTEFAYQLNAIRISYNNVYMEEEFGLTKKQLLEIQSNVVKRINNERI